MKMESGLLKKFLSFGMGNIIVLILGFISTPIITRIVKPEDMGVFSMFSTISNLIVLIALLGLDQAFVRFFYEEIEEERFNLMKRIVKIPIYIMILLTVVGSVLYKPISKFIFTEISVGMFYILVLQCFLGIISRFLILYIRMEQRAKLYSTLQIIGKAIYIIGIIVFLNFTQNYKLLVISLVLSNLIITVISLIIQRKNIFSTSEKKIKTEMRQLLQYGMPLVVTMAITWIMQSIDKIFIKNFSGYTELGLYASAFSIVALINAIQGAFTTFWVPVANEKFKSNPDDRKFFEKITKGITIIMLLIAILVIVFKDLLIILLGNEYRQAMFIFPFLVFIPVMYTISETTVVGISFMKKTKYTIWIALLSAIANIIGNMILVPSMGAKGAAISTGIAYIIFFVSRTLISKKLYNVNYGIHKILFLVFGLSILALYSSFNTFNNTIILLGIGNILILILTYKKLILDFIKDKKIFTK